MVEALIKIAGSLFIGGLGLIMIIVSVLIGAVLINVLFERWRNES